MKFKVNFWYKGTMPKQKGSLEVELDVEIEQHLMDDKPFIKNILDEALAEYIVCGNIDHLCDAGINDFGVKSFSMVIDPVKILKEVKEEKLLKEKKSKKPKLLYFSGIYEKNSYRKVYVIAARGSRNAMDMLNISGVKKFNNQEFNLHFNLIPDIKDLKINILQVKGTEGLLYPDNIQLLHDEIINLDHCALYEIYDTGSFKRIYYGDVDAFNASLDQEPDPLPEVQKITEKISMLIEKEFLHLSPDQRYWGKHRGGTWMMAVKRKDDSGKFFKTNEVYFPKPDTIIMVEEERDFSITIKSTEMATKVKAASKKKAAKKVTGKKTATKKVSTKREGPGKKETVAKYLKAGKTAAEILELMKKNEGLDSTLSSVRQFIQAINKGE